MSPGIFPLLPLADLIAMETEPTSLLEGSAGVVITGFLELSFSALNHYGMSM